MAADGEVQEDSAADPEDGEAREVEPVVKVATAEVLQITAPDGEDSKEAAAAVAKEDGEDSSKEEAGEDHNSSKEVGEDHNSNKEAGEARRLSKEAGVVSNKLNHKAAGADSPVRSSGLRLKEEIETIN